MTKTNRRNRLKVTKIEAEKVSIEIFWDVFHSLWIEKTGEEHEETEAVDEQKEEQEPSAEQEMEPESDEKQEEIESAETNGIAEKTNESVHSRDTPTGSSDGEKQRSNMKKAIEQTMSSILTKNKIEIKIPPIWTPSDKRANAALIYLYFRSVSWQKV